MQLGKFLECGSCPLSTLCLVTAIQTRVIQGNSVGTKQATTDGFCGSTTPWSLQALWESRPRGVDISLFVLTEPAWRFETRTEVVAASPLGDITVGDLVSRLQRTRGSLIALLETVHNT